MKCILTAILSLCLSALGADAAAQPNGCGSGWSTKVVPDKIRLLNCSMKTSCDTHDTCYSKCEGRVDGICEYQKCRPSGALYGAPVCKTDAKLLKLGFDAQTRRAACDTAIAIDITSANPNNWACRAVAIIYSRAVKTWGDSAFSGYGSPNEPLAWAQTQEDYDKAIADFIQFSNEQDFKDFVIAAESGKPQVNFCGRLKYSKDSGLTNVSAQDKKACTDG
jgi:hypothetical protein